MFLELIAVFVAGFAGAGVVLILNKLLGGRLPRWLMPVGAGLAMLAATISNEYGWYPRTVQNLPEGLVVATTVEEQAFYRPWTYARPFVSRFLAVDMGTMRANPALPDQRIVDVYAFGRWSPVVQLTLALNCATGQQATLGEGIRFADDGSIEGANWRAVDADDPILQTGCGG